MVGDWYCMDLSIFWPQQGEGGCLRRSHFCWVFDVLYTRFAKKGSLSAPSFWKERRQTGCDLTRHNKNYRLIELYPPRTRAGNGRYKPSGFIITKKLARPRIDATMWSDRTVQTANRLAVPLLVLMGLAKIAMAIGLIPMSLFWGLPALQGSAASVIGALILVFMAQIIDKRASSEQPSRWIRAGAWFVTVVLLATAVTNFSSGNFLERLVLGVVNILATICCGIVASSTPGVLAEPLYEDIPTAVE